MFNWNHFNNGDLQNWFSTQFFNPMQGANAQNPFMAGANPFAQQGFSNPFAHFEQYAQQFQSTGTPLDWGKLTQSGFEQFFDTSTMQTLVEQLQQQHPLDDTVIRESLQHICDQWFAHAQQLTGLTEPAWLHSQIALLKIMREGLRTQIAVPKPFQNMVETWRNNIDAQESCLQSMSQLTACFNNLQQTVSERFMADVEALDEITSMEQLFSTWIAAFERCYNDVALAEEFQIAYAQFVKNIAQLRLLTQEAIDAQVEQLGLPSHREMDTVLQRLSQTRSQIRLLKEQVQEQADQLSACQKSIEALQATCSNVNPDSQEKRLAALEKEIATLKKADKPKATKAKSTTATKRGT